MIFKGIKGGKELKMLANKKIKNYYTKVRNESDLQQYMKKIKNGGKKKCKLHNSILTRHMQRP